MKTIFGLVRAVVLSVLFFGAVGYAQGAVSTSSKTCFVETNRLFEVLPQGRKYLELRRATNAELKELNVLIQGLYNAIILDTATTEERQKYITLVKTKEMRELQIAKQLENARLPIMQQIEVAIAKIAPARGCGIVLDDRVLEGATSVMYYDAKQYLNITEDVVLELKK